MLSDGRPGDDEVPKIKRSLIEVSKSLGELTEDEVDLKDHVDQIRHRHEKLALRIRRHVHRKLHVQAQHSNIMKEFGLKSMATVAGWMTAQTAVLYIDTAVKLMHYDQQTTECIGWAIYVSVITVVVPMLDWVLRDVPETKSFKRDQIFLFKTCLPMFFAWAWKGLVGALLALGDGAFWVQLVVAFSLTGFVIVAELCPCYSQKVQAINEKGNGDTILARILVFPGHLGLSVGFAWNSLCKYWVHTALHSVQEPLLVFMVESAYFCIITVLMIALVIVLMRRIHDSKEDMADAEREPDSLNKEMLKITNQLEFVTSATALDAVHFVYAWGQLDLLNAFFFTYLLGCHSPTTCESSGHQSNFAFASLMTLIASKGVSVLTMERRVHEVNRAFSDLARKALGLNVGWAWANWTSTAIADATSTSGSHSIPTPAMYSLCVVFAWVVISIMHHRFEVERRAWDKHVEDEADLDNP